MRLGLDAGILAKDAMRHFWKITNCEHEQLMRILLVFLIAFGLSVFEIVSCPTFDGPNLLAGEEVRGDDAEMNAKAVMRWCWSLLFLGIFVERCCGCRVARVVGDREFF